VLAATVHAGLALVQLHSEPLMMLPTFRSRAHSSQLVAHSQCAPSHLVRSFVCLLIFQDLALIKDDKFKRYVEAYAAAQVQ
jgi:hypothetical protein